MVVVVEKSTTNHKQIVWFKMNLVSVETHITDVFYFCRFRLHTNNVQSNNQSNRCIVSPLILGPINK